MKNLFSFLFVLMCVASPVYAVDWDQQAIEDGKQDKIVLAFDGEMPNRMVCDTVPRILPDGRIALYFLAGGKTEPSPENYIGVIFSSDGGDTWSKLEPVNIGFPREGNTIGQGPTEWFIVGNRITMFFATHAKHWDTSWRSWTTTSDDNGKTWTTPQPLPGRLAHAAFIRPAIVTQDGKIMVPFQHYLGKPEKHNSVIGEGKKNENEPYATPVTNSRNGVLISSDGGKTWSEHGNIRLPLPENTHLWAEPSIVETVPGKIVMLIRPEWGGGTTLYRAESNDGGLTWPEVAEKTDIPNPSSKATLFRLAENTVALVHNPNPNHRRPLALWVSFDGMKTWPYKRIVVAESCDGPKGNLNYPEGYVSEDKQWLCFAFDNNRHQAVFVRAKLPSLDFDVLNMSMETPILITNPGDEYSDSQRNYNMTIGIERTPKGRLWSAWVSGGDSDKGYFVLASSDDEGKTWSKPRLVIDPTEAPSGLKRRILVGNLWADPTGKLWLFFDQSMGYYDGRAGDWAIVCENPDADEPVWSTPRRIWHGATLSKPTVLTSGEWLLPISLWERKMIGPKDVLGEAHYDLDDFRGANVFVSTNQGKHWHFQGRVRFPNHSFDEHMIVEKNDGSLWMLARTDKGTIMQSFSNDKGQTWSKPTDAFPHVAARFFIRRLASGNILFIKHGKIDQRTKGRSHLTAYLSEDDGETWKGGLVLDERDGISYPDGFQMPDGRIFVQYDRDRGGAAEILLATFTEADVLAGSPVSGKYIGKQIVSKALGKKK